MAPELGVVAGAPAGMFGAVVPMAPEEGADMPVPGAVISALPEAGAMALPGGALIAPDDAGVDEAGVDEAGVDEEDEDAGVIPALAFCRLWSLSFAVSASPDEAPFFIMPCLPCIL